MYASKRHAAIKEGKMSKKICKKGLHEFEGNQCKECSKIWKSTPEAKAKKKALENKPLNKIRTRIRTISPKYKAVRKNSKLLKIYNITQIVYNEMLLAQCECCAICSKHRSEFTKALSVDHCHDTGKVRGLLCSPCNLAIGNFQENIESILKAVDYLKRGKNEQ